MVLCVALFISVFTLNLNQYDSVYLSLFKSHFNLNNTSSCFAVRCFRDKSDFNLVNLECLRPHVYMFWCLHTQGLSFTSTLLQDSLKERLWTRYQQITDRGTAPWPLGAPSRGALFPLIGLGSSTVEQRTDAWWGVGGERERERDNRQGGRTETQTE